MRLALLLATAAVPAAAAAQDAPTDPPAALSVDAGATLVSDYRYRGISRSNRRVAVQGTAGLSLLSGVYASVWASTLADSARGGADAEVDLAAGYSRDVGGGVSLDGGLRYYAFPGSNGMRTDYFEPYASASAIVGPLTARATANYAWKQRALSVGAGREDNLYLSGDLLAAIPTTPVSLTAHLGRTTGRSSVSVAGGYTDWSLGARETFALVTLGLRYVDTNKNVRVAPHGRNLTGAGVVASAGVSF